MFSEFELSRKIMSDVGSNFISDEFKQFYKNNEHRVSYIIIIPSQKQWTGRGMYKIHEAYMKKCIESNEDIHVALLEIRSTPIEPGLLRPATLLFNCPK